MENIDYIYKISKNLTVLEKIKLIEKIISEVEKDLQVSKKEEDQISSLRGLWKDFDISISRKTIDELRAEMWTLS
jgi:hypothetical protein